MTIRRDDAKLAAWEEALRQERAERHLREGRARGALRTKRVVETFVFLPRDGEALCDEAVARLLVVASERSCGRATVLYASDYAARAHLMMHEGAITTAVTWREDATLTAGSWEIRAERSR